MSGFEYSSRHWLGKASAGLLLGLALALALSALFAIIGPDGLHGGSGKLQFTMWMVSPIWVLILGFCFLFRSGWAAWGWLGLANALAFALLYAVQP